MPLCAAHVAFTLAMEVMPTSHRVVMMVAVQGFWTVGTVAEVSCVELSTFPLHAHVSFLLPFHAAHHSTSCDTRGAAALSNVAMLFTAFLR